MSHNPNTVKSFDELNEGGRKSDVLVEAISKLETTTKKCELLQEQLDIAAKGIKAVLDDELFCETADGGLIMYLYTALDRIKELKNES